MRTLSLPLATFVLLSLFACNTLQQAEQKHYLSVFQDETSTFRGINLKDDKKKVLLLNDKKKPIYDDLLGLKYEYTLPEGKLSSEYYIDNLRTGQESNRVSAILLKINWQDEIGTAKLYDEIHRKFTQKYGLASGKYGDWIWESAAYQMTIYLRLSAEKTGIQIQFVGQM